MSIPEVRQEEPRAKLNLDFGDDDTPVVISQKSEVQKKVQEISERTGFLAKATPAKKAEPEKGSSGQLPSNDAARPSRKRAKTGRTHPFNTKIKPETYDELCRLADDATQEEGRPVSLAETLERAIDALKAREAV